MRGDFVRLLVRGILGWSGYWLSLIKAKSGLWGFGSVWLGWAGVVLALVGRGGVRFGPLWLSWSGVQLSLRPHVFAVAARLWKQ